MSFGKQTGKSGLVEVEGDDGGGGDPLNFFPIPQTEASSTSSVLTPKNCYTFGFRYRHTACTSPVFFFSFLLLPKERISVCVRC